MEKKHNGAHNELIATCWLMRQGYVVFRNVSPHGEVDIIGLKDGHLTLFDVKKATVLVTGNPTELKLRADQIAMGVKLLMVYGDNLECKIIDEPKPVFWRKEICRACSKEFSPRKGRQVFCSRDCRVRTKNGKRYACAQVEAA